MAWDTTTALSYQCRRSHQSAGPPRRSSLPGGSMCPLPKTQHKHNFPTLLVRVVPWRFAFWILLASWRCPSALRHNGGQWNRGSRQSMRVMSKIAMTISTPMPLLHKREYGGTQYYANECWYGGLPVVAMSIFTPQTATSGGVLSSTPSNNSSGISHNVFFEVSCAAYVPVRRSRVHGNCRVHVN